MTPTTAQPPLTKRCPKCGKTYPDEYTFCPDDAANLTDVRPSIARRVPTRPLLAAGVVVAVIAGVAVSNSHRHRAEVSRSAGAVAGQANGPASQAVSPSPSAGAGTSDVTGPPARIVWDNNSSDILDYRIEYPAGWQGSSSFAGTSARVTYAQPGSDVRITLNAEDEAPQSVSAQGRFQSVDREMRRAYGPRYQLVTPAALLSMEGTTAAQWVYTQQSPNGALLETLDVTIPHAMHGRSYALRCTAPAMVFSAWRPDFDKIVQDFRWGG